MRPFAAPFSGEELMDAETFSEVYAHGARSERRRAEPHPTPASDPQIIDLADLGARVVSDPPPTASAALEAEIDRSHSREAVARLAVRLARSYTSAAALFLVRRDMIEGLCGEGLAGRPDAVLFPAAAASVFGEVAGSGRTFRGAPPAQGLDPRVLRALGRDRVHEIAVLPVRVAGRTVNLLYADNGSESLGEASAAALDAICARVGNAYERLIRERKRQA